MRKITSSFMFGWFTKKSIARKTNADNDVLSTIKKKWIKRFNWNIEAFFPKNRNHNLEENEDGTQTKEEFDINKKKSSFSKLMQESTKHDWCRSLYSDH